MPSNVAYNDDRNIYTTVLHVIIDSMFAVLLHVMSIYVCNSTEHTLNILSGALKVCTQESFCKL